MPVSYQQAKIYKIVNSINDTEYFGSTAQKLLSSRFTCHRRLAQDPTRTSLLYTAMRTLGVGNFRILLVHAFPCNSKAELEAEEYKVLTAAIKAGTAVYNMRTAEGLRIKDETKKKIRDGMIGKIGAKCNAFKCGSMVYRPSANSWIVTWYEAKVRKSKTFGCGVWGNLGAKRLAQAHRHSIYPDYIPTDEELWLDDLMTIELD